LFSLLATAPVGPHTLALHDALPIFDAGAMRFFHKERARVRDTRRAGIAHKGDVAPGAEQLHELRRRGPLVVLLQRGELRLDAEADRKSTRLNSSHVKISYAVFCLKQ